jgi:hypothetical protein
MTEVRFSLVLAGGGARGFAHVGVLRALERCGYAPAALVGVSISRVPTWCCALPFRASSTPWSSAAGASAWRPALAPCARRCRGCGPCWPAIQALRKRATGAAPAALDAGPRARDTGPVSASLARRFGFLLIATLAIAGPLSALCACGERTSPARPSACHDTPSTAASQILAAPCCCASGMGAVSPRVAAARAVDGAPGPPQRAATVVLPNMRGLGDLRLEASLGDDASSKSHRPPAAFAVPLRV